MKFVATIVAAFLGLASAKKAVNNKELARRLEKGQFNKQTLMAKAKPYGRKLDQENQFEITGEYSIQFDHCVSLKLQDENLFDDNYIAYSEEGQILSEKSYITFNVCKTEYCYYEEEDAKNTYIVDIGTFVTALADYLPQQQELYCQGCQDNEDYCMGNLGDDQVDEQEADDGDEGEGDDEDGEEDDEDGEGDEDDGEDDEDDGEDDEDGEDEDDEDRRRKLSKSTKRRKLAEQNTYVEIDCDQCNEFKCFEDEEDNGDNGDDAEPDYDDVVEWLQGVAECNELENMVWEEDGETALFAGLICNSDGSGVEVAVFLDEDCTMYTTTASYSDVIQANNNGNNNGDDDQNNQNLYAVSQKSTELVQYMFTNDLSCDATEIVYYNPYEMYDEDDNEDNEDEENEEAAEANEWCQNIMNGDDQQALSIAECEAEDEEEQDEEEEGDDYVANYEWYSYQIKEGEDEDLDAVCVAVRNMDGEYTHVYDESSGSMFDYTVQSESNSGGLGGGAIAAIVIVSLIVVAVGAAWALGGSSKKDTKKKPLISGSMA